MKVTFPLPNDGKEHIFCFYCHADGAKMVHDAKGHLELHCAVCGRTSQRCIYISKAKYWLANDDELWHETGGVFVRRPDGKFLFFERQNWPFGYNIPCGHVDAGESGEHGALRELNEEVGVEATHPILIDEVDLPDSCSAGADFHRWHVYAVKIQDDSAIRVREEGSNLRWLTLSEALELPLPPAIRALVEQYRHTLEKI
jgi:ADP-ribose pyrophosphatase YjhB (NUDIX family)